MKKTLLLAAVLASGLVCQSRADTFSFWYSGAGVAADGVLTTGAYNSAIGGYAVTGITGERNGVAIDGLVSNPNSPGTATNTWFWYDNLFLTSTGVDYYGIVFSAGGLQYNVYLDTNTYYDLSQAQQTSGSLGTVLTTVGTKRVPDAATTAALLGLGLLFIGLVPSRKYCRSVS
jgi:hypothetical protein